MATIDLGKIKFNWKGAYASGTAYTVDDVVESGGSSYVCILASTGNTPPNATYWELMADKGTDTSVATTQGDVIYHNGTSLARLGAGTSGHFLKTQGTGSNPVWGEAGGKFESQLLHITRSPKNTDQTNTWSKIDLDTVETNEITGASLSNGTIILPAGTYFTMSSVQFYRVNDYNAKLRNVSDSVDLIIGSGGHTWASPDDASTPAAYLNGRFTLSAQKNVELQYYISTGTSQTSYQNGKPNQILIWKTA